MNQPTLATLLYQLKLLDIDRTNGDICESFWRSEVERITTLIHNH